MERDLFDIEVEVMMALEFLKSNPSQEVAKKYALDRLRQSAQRDARENLRKLQELDGE